MEGLAQPASVGCTGDHALQPNIPALPVSVPVRARIAGLLTDVLFDHALPCQDGGGPAREVLQSVTTECRTRIEMYAIALQRWAEAELSGTAVSGAPAAAGGAAQPAKKSRRRRQAEQQQEPAGSAPQQQRPPPPRPFTISQAALLLTGLAKARMRVGGLVEPMLLQCEVEIGQAAASDVARILIALGELHMEVGE